MPFVKVYMHTVWCTKNRVPYLSSEDLRQTMWDHIKMNALEKDIHVDYVNGYSEHCHCLISLKADQAISKVMQLIKGESAFWFNKQKFINKKFQWQDEYYAVGVSESMIEKTRQYIMNQEEHHKKKSFKDELEELMKLYGFGKLL